MSRLKIQIIWGALTLATWFQAIGAYMINTTIHDTNLAHVTYSDAPIECNRWVTSWLFQTACDSWVKPWKSGIYHYQGKIATYHSSLNHQFASVAIEFKGTDVWVYGPPASRLAKPPPDYKICFYESHHLSSKHECYQINIKKAYSVVEDEDEPVVIFARGQLQDQQHRIVISIADPVDDLKAYSGIEFSHVVYTTERPTPWPVKEDHWRYREVVMHDTHPLISYTPPVSLNQPTGKPTWLAKVHTAEDGTVMSWHELQSHSEGDQNQWRVETKLKAGVVAVYGAPIAYIQSLDNLGFVCVQIEIGLCETVDLKTIYANQKYCAQHEPVLLWQNDALDPSRETHISIRSAKVWTGTPTIFPFKSISYFEAKEYPYIGSLATDHENVTINHDDEAISYNPESRRISQSWYSVWNSWFGPWVQKKVGPSGSILTYRSTLARYRAEEDPYVSLNFSATAVYLYGAPNVHVKRPFAPQHVCIDNLCRLIDIEQAYLHPRRGGMESTGIGETRSENTTNMDVIAPLLTPHPELEPVLIWSTTDLDDKVEHTLRLALASLPSPDDAEMTFVKAVCTRVNYLYGDRLDPPTPEPEYPYRGPSRPLHATQWVPLEHRSLPPISINPPPNQPLYLLLSFFVLLESYRFLRPKLRFWLGGTSSRSGPLFPGTLPPSPQPALSQVYPEPSPLRPPNEFITRPTNPSNANSGPSQVSWGHSPGSPPSRYSNATDALPYGSSAAMSDSNRQR